MENDKEELSLLRKILKVAKEGLPVEDTELAKARKEQERLRKKAKGRPARSVRSVGRHESSQLEKLD